MGTTTQKMTDEQQRGAFTRRQFLKGSGVLVVGFSTAAIAPWEKLAAAAQGVAVADYPEFDLAAVDSFLEVHADGFVLIKIGKINNGQGTPTSWVMIAADELDVPLDRVQVRFGDTADDAGPGRHGRIKRHFLGVQSAPAGVCDGATSAAQDGLRQTRRSCGEPDGERRRGQRSRRRRSRCPMAS